ncbi:MAG: 3-keto-disaccharide hydrolase [Gemmataceae bacterium]
MPLFSKINLSKATVFTLCLGLLLVAKTGFSQAPNEKAEWKSLFDGKTLKGWKQSDFFKPGKSSVKDGAIILEKGTKMTGLTYDGKDFPKMNYEVSLESKRIDGRDFFCTTTFPVGDSFCSFVVGGWGGSVTGLSSIDGIDASENQTGQGIEYKNDQWYKIRIRVTDKRVETWIDKEQTVDLDTSDVKLGIRIECNVSTPFGIASYDTVGAVKDIKVRNLSAAEIKEVAKKSIKK